MAKNPSLAELGSDLLVRIQADPADAEALDAMVRGRALIYAAATEALTVLHGVAAKPAGPPLPLAVPAIDLVQRHVAMVTGQWVPDAQLMPAARQLTLGGAWVYILFGVAYVIAIPIYGAIVMSTPSGARSFVDAQILGWIALMGTMIFGLAVIGFGLWTRMKRAEPMVRARTDVLTLAFTALAAGRSLGGCLPGVQTRPMLRHLPEGTALWILHSLALERLAAGDRGLNLDDWHPWHRFAADLAMAAWLVAQVARERPPAIVEWELGRMSFRTRSNDELPLYLVLGAFDGVADSLPYNPDSLRDRAIPEVIGVGLVVVSGGLEGLRGLLQGAAPSAGQRAPG
jgi:hypothetical protein